MKLTTTLWLTILIVLAALAKIAGRALGAFGQQARKAFARDQIMQTAENVATIIAVLVGTMVVASFVVALTISGMTGDSWLGLAIVKTALLVGLVLIPVTVLLGVRLTAPISAGARS